MTRRRGVFEGLPRVFYRRTGSRYVDACAVAAAVNGVAVAGFGAVTVAFYVDLSAGELAVLAASWAAFFLVEGLFAAFFVRRAGDVVLREWPAAAQLPLDLLRHPSLYVAGFAGAAGAGLVLAGLLALGVRLPALASPERATA